LITGSSNPGTAAARAKTRKSKLIDRNRLRQLIQQSPEQLATSVADSGYRTEIDIYAAKHSGSDLIELALTQNLENELVSVLKVCTGKLKEQVRIYAERFTYQNAKTVLRAISTKAALEEVAHAVLPEENEGNASWLSIISNSDSLFEAAELMKRLPLSRAFANIDADASLSEYEDALDRHYFETAIVAAKGTGLAEKFLRNHLQMEIDHRNILNIFEAHNLGLSTEDIRASLLDGGKLIPTGQLNAFANADDDGVLDMLRRSSRFDCAGLEGELKESKTLRTLDPVVMWLRGREQKDLARMSYLHPLSALPVIHYISLKVQEVNDLRLIVRGVTAGLSAEVLEAHIL
jgi:vacuolar-type H+-ATPase subunit C/Vma6|tara:strand:- start:138 stop:1181 length:1044 start_codon:yes stop_codon:yes gene_type:complete